MIVDQAYLVPFGVSQLDDEFELSGYLAVVRGISDDVRTFTASPFVFTSLQQAIAAAIPNVEVLTTKEFSQRTILYWMIETGVGLTAVITAILGMAVSAVVVSQTLHTLTQEHSRFRRSSCPSKYSVNDSTHSASQITLPWGTKPLVTEPFDAMNSFSKPDATNNWNFHGMALLPPGPAGCIGYKRTHGCLIYNTLQ